MNGNATERFADFINQMNSEKSIQNTEDVEVIQTPALTFFLFLFFFFWKFSSTKSISKDLVFIYWKSNSITLYWYTLQNWVYVYDIICWDFACFFFLIVKSIFIFILSFFMVLYTKRDKKDLDWKGSE